MYTSKKTKQKTFPTYNYGNATPEFKKITMAKKILWTNSLNSHY